MSRRRYIWDPALGQCVEVTSDYVGQRRDNGLKSEEEVYGHITATDGTDLSTRRRHQEYMKQKGLTVAADFIKTWEREAVEKKKAATPGSGHDRAERRELLGRLNHQMGHPVKWGIKR